MEGFSEPQMSPEAQEEMRLFGLIGLLKHHVLNALRYEERLRHASLEANQPTSRTEAFVVHNVQGDQHAPGGHNHLILIPDQEEQPVKGITRVDLRVPELTPLVDPEDVTNHPQWNDVFIEVHSEDGSSQNYLLNSYGMIPFVDADTDIEMALDTSLQPDLYVVREPAAQPLPTRETIFETLSEVLGSYVYQSQQRDPHTPISFNEAS